MAAPGRRASFTPFTAFRPVADEKCDCDSAVADDYLCRILQGKAGDGDVAETTIDRLSNHEA